MELERLFGSRVRARTLQTLAWTSKPLSAYRVSKAIAAQPIQVLSILKSLEPLVVHGPEGWSLRDEDLRRFLMRGLREEDCARREEKDEMLARLGLRGSVKHGRGGVR